MQKIHQMRERLEEIASEQCQRDLHGVDTHELSQVVDMIKDLACAEKACLEADYYEAVLDSMEQERYGYQPERYGYKNQYGSHWQANPSNRRMRRKGYSEEGVENLRMMMDGADPERRKRMKSELEQLVNEL